MNSLNAHEAILREKVFQTKEKWPQFNLLINDLLYLSKVKGKNILSLERTLLYGGYSLFKPFFYENNFISIDVSPETADKRGAYNYSMIDHPGFIKEKYSDRVLLDNLDLEENAFDYIIVPNLVHHIDDQEKFFVEIYKGLKPGGILYVFEGITRELHQQPSDYLRYTPYGLKAFLSKLNFIDFEIKHTGGVFETISYVYQQALEYIPHELREDFKAKMMCNSDVEELCKLDLRFNKNLDRNDTSFPTAFSIQAKI